MATQSFLDRENTIAGPGYSRWLFSPAVLAVHMWIGQVYAFSVFNIPLSKLVLWGVSQTLIKALALFKVGTTDEKISTSTSGLTVALPHGKVAK